MRPALDASPLQGLFISFLVGGGVIDTVRDGKNLQNFLICLEMLLASFGMLVAFPFSEYKSAGAARACSGCGGHVALPVVRAAACKYGRTVHLQQQLCCHKELCCDQDSTHIGNIQDVLGLQPAVAEGSHILLLLLLLLHVHGWPGRHAFQHQSCVVAAASALRCCPGRRHAAGCA